MRLPDNELSAMRTSYVLIAHHQELIAQLKAQQVKIIEPFVDTTHDWHIDLNTGVLTHAAERDRQTLRDVRQDGDKDRPVTHVGVTGSDSE